MTLKCSENRRTAFFAGSFNPFTCGHLDILERGLKIFDEIVVGVGYNAQKSNASDEDIERRLSHIRSVVGDNPRVKVVAYGDLTVEAARCYGATALLRGIRSVSDFDYESRMADINRQISGIETVLLIADGRWASLSSSMVRELEHYGCDVSQYIPGEGALK